MSDRASVFVERHRLWRVKGTKGEILMVIARHADDGGRARVTQRDVEYRITASLPTVKRYFAAMQRPDQHGGPILEKARGRGWVILGVAEHDVMTCPDDECTAEAQSIRRGATGADKRAKAAERKRRERERKRRERESAQRL